MRELGVSANLMSLGALDFGLIVDASVVMVENFVRRLQAQGALSPDARRDRIREAAFEVGRPVVFGVAIIVAVYIPIFTLEGLEGRMFRPMAFTVCAAVLGSLVLALTYVPAASAYLLTRGSRQRHARERARGAMVRRASRAIRARARVGTHTSPSSRGRGARAARGVARVGAVSRDGVHAEAR